MKSLIRYFLIASLSVLTWACNNDFLTNDELMYYTVEQPLVISSRQPQSSISINIPEAGDHPYYIRTLPKWMTTDPMQGRFSEGRMALMYTMGTPEYQTGDGYSTGLLEIVVEGVGYYRIEIWYGNFNNGEVPDGNGGETPSVTEGDVTKIDGIVVDAAYDKAHDRMIIATKNPNQLLVVQTNTGTSSLIELDMKPQCLTLSDDGKAYVGFTVAYLSVFNLETKQQELSYALDCVPYDVALGDNGWCYISPLSSDFEGLRSLNLNTGEITETGQNYSYNFYGKPRLNKIPGTSLLAASRHDVTPSGFLLIDISQGAANDTVAYWHEDLYNFWIGANAKHVYTGTGKVLFMPEYNTSYNTDNLNTYGNLELDRFYIADLEESTAKNCLFVAVSNDWDEGYNNLYQGSLIQQFDTQSLSLQKRYEPSLTLINQNGVPVAAFHDIRYVFANSTATKLYAVRRTAADFSVNDWSYEVFEVE